MADLTSEPLLFCLAATLFTCWRTGWTRLVGAGDRILFERFDFFDLMGVSFMTAARSPWRRVEAARVVAGHGLFSGPETRVVLEA